MSLKLGNTNIAGTQVLYSTTGNNTDGAMTQNATTTQLNLKANDADAVHKTGNETVGGVKTFAGDGWLIKIQNTDVTYNIAPSSYKGTSIVFTDKNGTQIGCVETIRYSSNNTLIRFNVFGANGNWASPLELMVDQNGTTTTFAPASDVSNSIVTTVNKSKSENGYFKLGNGLIVQWGTLSSGKTITYSTAFTNADSYALVFNNNSTTSGYGRGDKIESKSSTSATVNGLCENPIRWLAIGY